MRAASRLAIAPSRVLWALALRALALSALGCSPDDPVPMPTPVPEPPQKVEPKIPDVPLGALVLNEVHATNLNGLLDEDGDPEDWIELYNPSDQRLDLTGVGLSLDKKQPFAFTFPAGTALLARSYLVVLASQKDRALWGRPLHAPFNLDNGEDRVYLTSAEGVLLDMAAPPRTKLDVSICRVPDATGPLQHCGKPTPGAANTGPAWPALLAAPTPSLPGGFYADTQRVALTTSEPGATIHYTLDGSDPSERSPAYSGPVEIASRVADPNVYSLISTTRQSFYTPTTAEVYKATVLRAATFADGKLSSPITTHTYFIDPSARYEGVHIASVVADPPQLFSSDNPRGIEVIGPSPGASPWYPGANWWLDREAPASIELFRPDRTIAFRTDFGVQISGGYSRTYVQKNLDVIFRDPYGARSITEPLFKTRGYDKFKRFRLRASGNELGRSQVRDLFMHQLFRDSPVDYSDQAPVITFLDGEYWGYMQLREKTTGNFLSQTWDVDDDHVDIVDLLVGPGKPSDTLEARDGSRVAFEALLNFVAAHPSEVQSDFALIQSLIDVENMTNWFAANQFAYNIDWPTNNVRAWREHKQDARWRFILHDDDLGFGYSGTVDSSLYSVIGNTSKIGALMGRLMKNPDFRRIYINTVADQLNSYFDQAAMNAQLDAILSVVAPLMPEHFARFRPNGATLATWNTEVAKIRTFIQNREPSHVRNTQTYFGLPVQPRYVITLNVNDVAMGTLKINTLDLSKRLTDVTSPWQGKYFVGVPITVTALPRPGHKFVRWQGASSSEMATVTLDLAADATLLAEFAPDPKRPPDPPQPPQPPAGLRNIAPSGVATQSSTSGAAGAGLAIDGDPSGDPRHGSLALTQSEPTPFWQLDLGQARALWRIEIFNRADCCVERLSRFHVFVSTTDMSGRSYASLVGDPAIWKSFRATPFGGKMSVPLGGQVGRYVRVQLSETGALALAEVQVMASPQGGAEEPAHLRNLALGKPASQSSTEGGATADRAVDGSPEGALAAGSVALTRSEATPHWEVDLLASHRLSAVRIRNRGDCCAEALVGVIVLVSEQPMAGRTLAELRADAAVWRREIPGPVGPFVHIPVEARGRYVRLQLKGEGALALAEVAVLGAGI